MIQASVFLSSFTVVSLLIKEKIDPFCLFIHSASCNTQEKKPRERENETLYYSFSYCCCKMDWFEKKKE